MLLECDIHHHQASIPAARARGVFHARARRAVNGIDVRPCGIAWRTERVDAQAMAEWRRGYNKTLAPGAADAGRLPSTWHAADAIAALQEAGALRDWGRLIALYPGW